MKKLWKRNQIMITALALMIAIAGYLNFMGKKVDEENLFTTSAQFEEASGVTTEDGTDMAAVTDITDESLALLPEQQVRYGEAIFQLGRSGLHSPYPPDRSPSRTKYAK